jgi:hypothetical protein
MVTCCTAREHVAGPSLATSVAQSDAADMSVAPGSPVPFHDMLGELRKQAGASQGDAVGLNPVSGTR